MASGGGRGVDVGVGWAGGCAAPAGLVADERANRDWVIVIAELDETLLVLLVVLSFLPFSLIPFPTLPLPTDPDRDPKPSEGEVAFTPGNGTGLVCIEIRRRRCVVLYHFDRRFTGCHL